MAEITGLLNRRTVLSRTGGSNPPLTATEAEKTLSEIPEGFFRFEAGLKRTNEARSASGLLFIGDLTSKTCLAFAKDPLKPP